MINTARVKLPKKLRFLLRPSRYKVPYGGRGSAKSWSVARILLVLANLTCIRVFCGREYQNSIQDSVHKLLSDQIHSMGMDAHYQITQNAIRNKLTGSEFLFDGLHNNTTKIKSTEGINIAWIEEAEKVTKASWDTLIPTVRTPWVLPFEFWPPDTQFTEEEFEMGGRQVSSEIWITFNPSEETDNTYQRFVVNTPPDCVSVLVNYSDNKWFPDELRKEMEYLKRIDYEDYLHIWEGQCTKKSAAQVLRGKWRSEAFEPEPDWDGPYYGTDWGFSVDPTAMTRCWIHENRLWIDHEAYGIGVDNDDLSELFDKVPGSREHVSRADNARPETISHCRKHGFPRMVGAEKWPGSVEDGINFLRGEFEEIIIHPRCTATLQEARLWSYKIDKNSGDVLPVLEDKNNHCWDSIRYALAPLIKNGVKLIKKWWRFWSDAKAVEARTTLKMIVLQTDDVSEDSVELRGVAQCWAVEAYSGMYLLEELSFWGTWPEWLAAVEAFWQGKGATELWLDNKAAGQTAVRFFKRKGLPAREWNPRPAAGQQPGANVSSAPDRKDNLIVDKGYRAKQASVHLSEGRIFVPQGAAVVTEIEGLSTDGLTLAVAIWSQRGGGRGPIPEAFI